MPHAIHGKHKVEIEMILVDADIPYMEGIVPGYEGYRYSVSRNNTHRCCVASTAQILHIFQVSA